MSAQKRSHDGSFIDVIVNPTSNRGIIRKLILENFMCHQKIKLDFCERINFIVGCNGSGKSAIMTAIVLVLGGNAPINTQKYIKTGEIEAKIEIDLENCEPEPYKYEVYGCKITILLTIGPMDASKYTIKDCLGNVISTELDVLNEIIAFFGIRVGNPILMLNQDKTQEVLRELEPKKSYELFLEAFKLNEIKENSIVDDTTNKTVEQKEKAEMEHKLQLETMKKRKLRHIATYVRHAFSSICKSLKVDEQLMIDHERKTIDILVVESPKNPPQDDYRMSTTIKAMTLLMALRATTNHPFYFIDGYDVLNDDNSHNLITKLLIQEGVGNIMQQHFCLTTRAAIDEVAGKMEIRKVPQQHPDELKAAGSK